MARRLLEKEKRQEHETKGDKVEQETKKTDEQKAQEHKAKAETRAKENAKRYENTNPDTLKWDENSKKYSVELKCECGETRRVFTSDLFQVKQCVECTNKARAERRKQKRAEKKALKLEEGGKV